MTEKKEKIQDQLKQLEEIATWFEKEGDFDVEDGLEKVKEGALLVKKLKARIAEVENEFKEIEATVEKET
jgi:exonuclease VII small subunit